eukprot:1002740_1
MSNLHKDRFSILILISNIILQTFGCNYIYLANDTAPYQLDTCVYNATYVDDTPNHSWGYFCTNISDSYYARKITYDGLGCKGNEISRGDLIPCGGGNTNCFCNSNKNNCLHSTIRITSGYNADTNECVYDGSKTNTTYVVLVCINGLGITCDWAKGPIRTQYNDEASDGQTCTHMSKADTPVPTT